MKKMNDDKSSRDSLERAYQLDEERYRSSSYGGEYESFDQAQIIGHMMLTAHSLEKGLSNDNFELGHGYAKIGDLVKMVALYNERNYNKRNPGYINALSILSAYMEVYKGSQYEEDMRALLKDIHPVLKSLTGLEEEYAGVKRVKFSEKKNNDKKNFKELAEGRASVRSFSEEPIDRVALKDAIRIAQKSPSACNRQSTRIYEIHSPEIITRVMTVQEGFGYKTPPQAILLVVADDSNFSGAGERNQGFVDGGMFAMSLMYALEYKKIAACPLHASFTYEKEQQFRSMLGIQESEKLIVFLALGQFRNDFVVAKSYRYPVDYVTKEITRISEQSVEVPGVVRKEKVVVKMAARKVYNLLQTIKHKTRVRTRLKNLQSVRQEDKFFLSVYIKLQVMARSKKGRIYVFGAPRHSNLGDQAQSLCIEDWCRQHYPSYNIVIIDTPSIFQKDNYVIRKIRSIIRPNDKIILHSGYHTTDVWPFENYANVEIINHFPDVRIYVFPQTIHFEDEDNLMSTVEAYKRHGNVNLMCRDKISFNIAKKEFRDIDITLMPDIVTTLIGTQKYNSKNRDGINMCFRNDKESKYGKNIEAMKEELLSITGNIEQTDTTVDIDPYFVQKNRKRVIFDQIHLMSGKKLTITDRYHGTIFSIIANTPVIVLGSTDHKLSSGVKWFADRVFSDLIYFASSTKEAVKIAKKVYGTYDYENNVTQYFNEHYWNKLSLNDESNHEK